MVTDSFGKQNTECKNYLTEQEKKAGNHKEKITKDQIQDKMNILEVGKRTNGKAK